MKNNMIWKKFYIEELFDIKRGNAKNISNKKEIGNVALISAIASNNGISNFVTAEEKELQMQNVYTINNNGDGVCISYYHKYNIIASSDVTFLIPKDKELCDENVAIFIKTVIEKQKQKYSYGYKMSDDRLKKQVIVLPTLDGHFINYKYIKSIVLELKQSKIAEYKKYYDKNVIIKNPQYISELDYYKIKWKPFKIVDIFKYDRGNQNQMNTLVQDGDMPLISAKNGNNGLKEFVFKNDKSTFISNSISFNNDGDGGVGYAFYQPYDYLLDSHCYSLKLINSSSKYVYLFMTVVLSKQRVLFSHGRSISESRLKSLNVMLPINDKDEPDYVFMENWVKMIIDKKSNVYFNAMQHK